jgi:hypothetical protein
MAMAYRTAALDGYLHEFEDDLLWAHRPPARFSEPEIAATRDSALQNLIRSAPVLPRRGAAPEPQERGRGGRAPKIRARLPVLIVLHQEHRHPAGSGGCCRRRGQPSTSGGRDMAIRCPRPWPGTRER